MYTDVAMGGPQRTISPEEIFLETQFSLASGHDQMPISSGFDMPNYPRRFWNDEHVLDVQIRHRTRSHKGWTSIATEDKIRVTKDRGKVFQVVLDSPLPFPKESVVLNLELNGQIVDAATGGLKVVRVSGVSTRVDNMQTKYSVEVSIKISALCDHLRVVASVATDTNHILTGKTVEFMTHNNGKVPLNQREESPEPKKVQFVVPSQSPPQCAMRQQPQPQQPQQPQQQRSSPQQPLPSQHMPYPQQQQQPPQQQQQQGLILGGEPQGFRGDQRQAIHSQYTTNTKSSLKGSGSGGKKGDIQNTNNMSLLYNKLVENSQPESPPHPVVGDCSSPESGVDDEPPLSQMKKRKYNPTPPRLHSPPHQTPSGIPPTAYHMHPQQQHQHQPYFAPMQPPQLYHHHHQQQPQRQHAQQAPPQPRSRKQAGHYSDSSYSSDSSSRNSGSLGAEGWGAAFGSSSPQSTPEEEFEMQEMAHGAEIASGQGSEEEEYGSCGSQTPLAPAPKNTAAQVINGDLSVRGAVRARAYMQYSDIRLKTDVEGIVDAIDLISKLDGKKYRWKPNAFERKGQDPSLSDDEDSDTMTSDSEDSDDIETGSQIGLLDGKATVWNFGFSSKEELEEPHEKKGQKVIGLIAQEVQRVLPEVVTEDADGYLSVAYAEIVPVLISAFNEHMANYNAEQTVLMRRFDEFERQLEDMTDEKETIDDKETLAQLAQEMKELIPETEYSRLVKKLSRIRRRDKIIQRNCCCLLILMFCFVIGLSVALALIAPVTYSNIYNVVYPDGNNNNNNDGNNYPDPFAAAAARVYQFVSVTSSYAFFSGTRVDTSTSDTLTIIASYNAKPPSDPFSLLISHSVSVPSDRRRGANPKDGDLLSLRTDDEDPALNFSSSLVSLFEYVEANGQSGFQSGETYTTLVAASKSSWIPLSSRTFTAHNDNGPVTVLCASSIGNSMLFVEACIAEQTVIYEGAVYSPDFVHMQVRVNRTLTARNYNYAVTLYLGSRVKSDVTYDVVTPSLIYSEEDNNAVVGQMTWQTSVAGNTTIIPSWKKAMNQMTFSFSGSEIAFPESWYFNVGIRYLGS